MSSSKHACSTVTPSLVYFSPLQCFTNRAVLPLLRNCMAPPHRFWHTAANLALIPATFPSCVPPIQNLLDLSVFPISRRTASPSPPHALIHRRDIRRSFSLGSFLDGRASGRASGQARAETRHSAAPLRSHPHVNKQGTSCGKEAPSDVTDRFKKQTARLIRTPRRGKQQ